MPREPGLVQTVSRLERAIALLMLAAAVAYLVPFVPRGWVPHDEGMMGQAAERVLRGGLPHVDYEDPYTGGLALFYAIVFRWSGIELLHLRWTLFVGACFTQGVVYLIARRFMGPVPAATLTWVALCWSFPNYFAGLPSWWVLICALTSLLALLRYFDTGQIRYVVAAGLAVGIAAVLKQTGVYLIPPLVLSTLIAQENTSTRKWQVTIRILGTACAAGAFAVAVLIVRRRLGASEIVYLLVPIAASCVAATRKYSLDTIPFHTSRAAPFVAVAAAALPMFLFLIPYAAAGELNTFFDGAFVQPQQRLEFASQSLPPAALIVAGVVALVWLFWSPRSLSRTELQVVSGVRWTVVLCLLAASFWSELAYRFIFACVRSMAALLPLVVLWLLTSDRAGDAQRRWSLFTISSMLAWASLIQFPYGAPTYFCYVAPLAFLAVVAIGTRESWPHRLSALPATALVLLFAVLSMNRGYAYNVGFHHEVYALDTPLDLHRAHLTVHWTEARTYRRVIERVRQQLGSKGLAAGPDTPEMYFLAEQFSRSGALYDFSFASSQEYERHFGWDEADVIVLHHRELFSPALSERLITRLRQQFPQGERVGQFEVRWR